MNFFLQSAKDVLHTRHIEPTSYRDTCGADRETISHILMDCTIAKNFWRQTQCLTGSKLPRLHPNSWASHIHRWYVLSVDAKEPA